MNIFHTGYALSVLGGLMATKWFDFRTVLGIGGALMTAATTLIGISIWFGLICQLGFYAFVWTIYPLYMGLMLPCLFYGFIRWSRGPRSRLILVVLYYYSAECSSWIEVTIQPLAKEHLQQHSDAYVAAAGLVLSLLFTALSATIKPDQQPRHNFGLPRVARLARYFRIFTAFTLFAIQLYDNHQYEYREEILLYSNSSNFTQLEADLLLTMTNVKVPRLVNMAGILCTSIALIVVGVFFRVSLFESHEFRIQTGIITAAAVAMGCFVADLILFKCRPVSPVLTTIIFCFAAYMDGVAEIITMVAVYELVVLISPREHRLIISGVALSVWNLAYFLRIGIHFLTFDVIMTAITKDQSFKYCVTHALNVVLLLACLFYARILSFPQAFTLIQDQEDDSELHIPLLSP